MAGGVMASQGVIFGAAALAGAVMLLAWQRGAILQMLDAEPMPVDLGGGDGSEVGQGGAALGLGGLLANVDPSAILGGGAAGDDANVSAFLAMIRAAEGTAGPNGYRTMFGGALFQGWEDHPRRPVQFTDRAGRRLWTTAAGAYQFMAASPLPGGGSTRVDTWGALKNRLKLPDFGPASQDAAAVELIREAGALADVRAGRFVQAVGKVRRIWASLPGAGYAQGERSMQYLREAYARAGGQESQESQT